RGDSPYGISDVEDFRGSPTTNPKVSPGFVSEDGVQLVERLNAFEQYNHSTWNSATKDGLLEAGFLPYNGHTLNHLVGTKISGSIFDENGKRHTAADLLQYKNPENILVPLNATASKILFTLGA
ncbi:hypothetical protein SUGI_1390580, partial [Cryptomeria japonica]